MTRIVSAQKSSTYSHKGKSLRILAIIPARGGSKGVPRKNLRPLGGEPLLYYMLKAAMEAQTLTRVVVSTEDDEIMQVAESLAGKNVVIRRPQELAQDVSADAPMLQHAVREVEKLDGVTFDYVVQLHATTPFFTAQDIDQALGLVLADPAADSVVSVFQVNSFHPSKLKQICGNRLQQYVEQFEEKTTSRRQDFHPVYKRNGGLYATKREVVMNWGRVWGDHVIPYVMPDYKSLEVDSPIDFFLADLLMKHLKGHASIEEAIK